ncbi:MAG: hypothetical protein D6819_02030 [Gammaproteobacteria bacterium]|nr:MAG: hypothetical protein D6819_02030 [Gammaproteobacteria bacterium]
MALRKLEKSEWEAYFDNFSKDQSVKLGEVEVLAKSIGAQIEDEWMPIVGLAYDPKDDEFEVITEIFDHHIRHPREIWVDEDIDGLKTVEVVQEDGTKNVIELRRPPALPKKD